MATATITVPDIPFNDCSSTLSGRKSDEFLTRKLTHCIINALVLAHQIGQPPEVAVEEVLHEFGLTNLDSIVNGQEVITNLRNKVEELEHRISLAKDALT